MPFDTDKLEFFPTKPGVYVMKDKAGKVLYVGKAKNLKQRVKQYFFSGRDSRATVPFLVAGIETIETVVVSSEKEALLLENTYIKQFQPKYNALLKDDKTYIAIKINYKHSWPMCKLTRYKGDPEPGNLYFGPYTSAEAARAVLELIHRLFPLRQCSDQEFLKRTRPCILYDMKQCLAPCVQKCLKTEYDALVNKTIAFLKGQDQTIVKDLEKEMLGLSERLEFEKAADILKIIRQIETTLEKQHVDRPFGKDCDVLGAFRQGEDVLLMQLIVRNGKVVGSNRFSFNRIAEDDADLFSSFLLQHYSKHPLPQEVLLSQEIEGVKSIEEILSQESNKKVRIHFPKRKERQALVKIALENAESAFFQEKDLQTIREKTLFEMQDKFRLANFPGNIECFDTSNISGEEYVAALATFKDGLKYAKGYRKYRLKSVLGPNDYQAMQEVLMRRYKRAKEEGKLPDLLIVDGGKGHLNIALKVLGELNIVSVDVIGLAKEEGRHDKGMTTEQVFLPGMKDAVILKPTSRILFLLQQIRDEAHRFAIAFHRKSRGKTFVKSALDDLPGIGPVKKRLLLKHFGSTKRIKEASKEELQKVKQLSQKDISVLQDNL